MPAIRRLAVAGGFAATLVGLSAAPALAHVSVSSGDAARGGEGVITFRVPTESDSPTTKVVVQLPSDPPIASVSVRPVPGWTHKETTTKLATPVKTDDGDEVSQVTNTVEWDAVSPAGGIQPGEYGEFSIEAGPLPDAASVTFKAIQTYANGTSVAWIEESANGAEAEHPAPVLSLAPAAPTAPSAGASAPASAAAVTSDNGSSGTAKVALVLGILGLLSGLVGLGVAVSTRRAGRPVLVAAESAGDRAGVQE